MFNISVESKAFLNKNIPEALKVNENAKDPSDMKALNEILSLISDWIDLNGFRQDGYYNENGKTAQSVYDDIYYNN